MRTDMRTVFSRRLRSAGIVSGALLLAASVASTSARAADLVGTSAVFSPEPGATLVGELITWQGEVLANKTTNGFTSFNSTGAAGASPINAGAPVKTMTTFNGLLTWVDTANTVKTSNPGGTVLTVGSVSPTANQLLGVGNQLWVARTGGIDRYAPTPTALGGASAITLSATATARMAAGNDGNVWVVEKTSGVDTLTRWNALGGAVGSAFNFANSAADPSGIVAGPDGAMWIILGGTNSIARVDSTGVYAETPLPAGAAPASIVAGTDGVWISENGLNNVAKLTYSGGAFTRTAFAAPSAFGLKGEAIGPDGNLWVVGTNVNKVAKFGTAAPATTTVPSTTVAPTSVAATTVAPTTVTPTTVAPTTRAVFIEPTLPQRVCTKYGTKKVRVKGKLKSQRVCVRYVTK